MGNITATVTGTILIDSSTIDYEKLFEDPNCIFTFNGTYAFAGRETG